MRTDNIKVKLTIPIPFNKPDLNGVVYSEQAVENAVNNLQKDIPIIYRDNDGNGEEKVIGTTIGNSHIVTYDIENRVYKVSIDGEIFFGGTECIVNEMEGNMVTDFRITGIGLSK